MKCTFKKELHKWLTMKLMLALYNNEDMFCAIQYHSQQKKSVAL